MPPKMVQKHKSARFTVHSEIFFTVALKFDAKHSRNIAPNLRRARGRYHPNSSVTSAHVVSLGTPRMQIVPYFQSQNEDQAQRDKLVIKNISKLNKTYQQLEGLVKYPAAPRRFFPTLG